MTTEILKIVKNGLDYDLAIGKGTTSNDLMKSLALAIIEISKHAEIKSSTTCAELTAWVRLIEDHQE